MRRVKCWEIIADNLHEAGWSLGCVSAIDAYGRTIWIADAHRDDGKRFVVQGVVANTGSSFRNGAVGFIDWLDLLSCPNEYEEADQSPGDNPTRNHVRRVTRFGTSLCQINHQTKS
jgi:hypothetical protein